MHVLYNEIEQQSAHRLTVKSIAIQTWFSFSLFTFKLPFYLSTTCSVLNFACVIVSISAAELVGAADLVGAAETLGNHQNGAGGERRRGGERRCSVAQKDI